MRAALFVFTYTVLGSCATGRLPKGRQLYVETTEMTTNGDVVTTLKADNINIDFPRNYQGAPEGRLVVAGAVQNVDSALLKADPIAQAEVEEVIKEVLADTQGLGAHFDMIQVRIRDVAPEEIGFVAEIPASGNLEAYMPHIREGVQAWRPQMNEYFKMMDKNLGIHMRVANTFKIRSKTTSTTGTLAQRRESTIPSVDVGPHTLIKQASKSTTTQDHDGLGPRPPWARPPTLTTQASTTTTTQDHDGLGPRPPTLTTQASTTTTTQDPTTQGPTTTTTQDPTTQASTPNTTSTTTTTTQDPTTQDPTTTTTQDPTTQASTPSTTSTCAPCKSQAEFDIVVCSSYSCNGCTLEWCASYCQDLMKTYATCRCGCGSLQSQSYSNSGRFVKRGSYGDVGDYAENFTA